MRLLGSPFCACGLAKHSDQGFQSEARIAVQETDVTTSVFYLGYGLQPGKNTQKNICGL